MEADSEAAQKVLQELLRELRSEAGLRQIDLAKALGLPQSMVSKFESGERRLDVIEVRELCEVLGISFPSFAERLERRLGASK